MCNKPGGFGQDDFVVEFLGEVGSRFAVFMFVSYLAAAETFSEVH